MRSTRVLWCDEAWRRHEARPSPELLPPPGPRLRQRPPASGARNSAQTSTELAFPPQAPSAQPQIVTEGPSCPSVLSGVRNPAAPNPCCPHCPLHSQCHHHQGDRLPSSPFPLLSRDQQFFHSHASRLSPQSWHTAPTPQRERQHLACLGESRGSSCCPVPAPRGRHPLAATGELSPEAGGDFYSCWGRGRAAGCRRGPAGQPGPPGPWPASCCVPSLRTSSRPRSRP